MLETRTSTSLLEGLLDPGNEAAWTNVVGRYRPIIVRFGLRVGLSDDDAEDAAQLTLDAFFRAFSAGDYDRDRGRLRTWLFGIARNQLRSWRRSRHRREIQPADDTGFFDRIEGTPDGLEEAWNREWRSSVLRQCLLEISAEITPTTSRAFELFALQNRPAAEVAATLEISENAVWLAKRRVLERIKGILPLMEEVF